MGVNRRFVLKAMALSGVAGLTMGSSVRALAAAAGAAPMAATRPVLALVDGGGAEAAFLHGARAVGGAQPRVQRVAGQGLDFMLDFERQLRSGQPMRVIGLLNDAAATLVVDLARSGGARVQWLGQHTAHAGFTRHRLLNTDLAEGCAQQLGRQLQACGAGFSLNEERQNGPLAPRQLAGPARDAAPSAQWVSSVGYLLASLGTRTMRTAPPAPPARTSITGSFVSFSIEA